MTQKPELPDFDQLWDYAQPAKTEQSFRKLLPQAAAAGDDSYHGALLTQLARTFSLRGLFAEAHEILNQVEEMASTVSPQTWSRYLLERGRTHNSAGESETAVPLFVEALQFAEEAGSAYHAIDAVHMLAIASPPEEQIRWGLRGLEMTEETDDPRVAGWAGPLLHNTAWTHHDLGRYEEALMLFGRSLTWREAHSQDAPHTIRIAKWSVGRALRSLDRWAEALARQQQLLADYEAIGEEDGFVYEEIAENLLALGQRAAAKPYFGRAYRLLAEIGWVTVDRLQRLHDLAESE